MQKTKTAVDVQKDFQYVCEQLASLKQQRDVAQGELNSSLRAIAELYPDYVTLADAEALLIELEQVEAEALEHYNATSAVYDGYKSSEATGVIPAPAVQRGSYRLP